MVDVQWTMVERRTSGRDSLVVLWSLLGRRLQLVPYGEELDRAKEMVTVYTEGGDVVQRGCTVPIETRTGERRVGATTAGSGNTSNAGRLGMGSVFTLEEEE